MTSLEFAGAYVDTTALVPIANEEQPVAGVILQRLERFQLLLSANLIEAELRAMLEADGRAFDRALLRGMNWIMPNRPLADEMATVAAVANLPAARLWHLAVALFFAELVPGLVFITLDEQQEAAARDLGLAV